MRRLTCRMVVGVLTIVLAGPAHASLYITEFLALNETGLTDEDGSFSDWVEIHNEGVATADLGGWYLTDDAAALTKWQFPATPVAAGGYIVVFASDKNRAVAGAQLHTNFKLSGGGEYLALVRPDGVTIEHEYAPSFPAQNTDVSWGLTNNLAQQRCFSNPTPGAVNQETPSCGVVESLAFSAERGFYDAPFSVTITSPTPGAQIYYTLDGSEPASSNGALYTAPIPVSTTTMLRAVAFAPPLLPAASITHTYLFLADVIHQTGAGFPTEGFAADYEMDPKVTGDPRYAGEVAGDLRTVPTISIVMNVDDMFGPENGIYSHPERRGLEFERPASAELIRTDGSTGFQINCGVRIQGRLSRVKDRKKSLRLAFKAIYGPPKLEYPMFPDTPVTRFNKLRLRASHNKSWSFGVARADYIRDQWTRDTQIDMGQVASHGIFAHIYINGLYWGLYNVVEQPEAEFAMSYFGGNEDEWDVLEPVDTDDGTRDAWKTAQDLATSGLETPAAYDAIRQYVDVTNLADYMITNIHAGTLDWDASNWYAGRRRLPGEGFRFFGWDAEQSMEVIHANRVDVHNVGMPSAIYAALRANAEFRVLFGDRLHKHFFNGGALTPAAAVDRYMKRAAEIDHAIVDESARWGDARRPLDPYDREADWLPEVEWLRLSYFPQRSAIVLDQFRAVGLYPSVVAPTFSQHGGPLSPSTPVVISAPAGTIYYTVDGSDPRLEGGAVAPSAIVYAAPVALSSPTTLRARALDGGTWSALNEAAFTPDIGVRVSELMYHPAAPVAPSAYVDDDFEFLELTNITGAPIDLTGFQISQGVTFTFGPWSLAPGGYVLVVRKQAAFQARYGSGQPIAGQYTGKLANEGERLLLENAAGDDVLDFTYADSWFPETDGPGHSLVVVDLDAERSAWSRADGWRASALIGGSPGTSELPLCSDGVDNDADGLADLSDPGCASASQDKEDPACNNGSDDDDDGATDLSDSQCASASDDDESAPKIDSFVCYASVLSSGGSEIASATVTVDDQFEAGRQFELRSPQTICVPAVVDPKDQHEMIVSDPATHLAGFAMKAVDGVVSPAVPGVFVEGLGPIYLDAYQADRLLVPAAVDASSPVAAPDDSSHALDHYECRRIKPAELEPRIFPRAVKLRAEDSFDSVFYDFKRPVHLCNPAAIDGSAVKNEAGLLMCYQAVLSRGEPRHTPRIGLHVATGFGATQLDTRRVSEICVPAH
ncbi:MAG TPA: chitobiase/beta-hexosaminidase C-terminal domain-containing protein [Candidatus Limnocylindrales bacterium]|nr:chitobiase/beta-hexosaminidase C-terminal domain-containing protein [Candidatus Limnocylindrales bacterium]